MKHATRRFGAGVVLACAYPVVAHVAILNGNGSLVAVSVALLVALMLLDPLRRGRRWAWALLAVAIALLRSLHDAHVATLPLFAPPVLIPAFVSWLFARTLPAGRTPLIEQIARALEGSDLDEAQRRYARQVTGAWAWLTAGVAAVSLVLSLLATPHGLLLALGFEPAFTVPLATWSFVAYVLNYVVLGAMFVAEHAYRRYRLPRQRHQTLPEFLRGLARLGPLFTRGVADAGPSRHSLHDVLPQRAAQTRLAQDVEQSRIEAEASRGDGPA